MLRKVAAAALVVSTIAGVRSAQAQSRDPFGKPPGVCIADNETAQDLETAGKLKSARSKALDCSRGCPMEIARDCTTLAERIGQKIPTVTFGAKQDGKDLVDVTVSIDGEVITSALDGRPVEVDPGARKVSFSIPGRQPMELQVVFNAAEKNRLVTVEFAPSASAAPTPVAPIEEDTWTPPALFWVFGSVSIASFVTAGVTGGLALSERSDLDACVDAKNCAQSDIDAVETKALASDVFLGVGSAFAVGAVLVLLLWPEEEDELVKPAVGVGAERAFIGVTASF